MVRRTLPGVVSLAVACAPAPPEPPLAPQPAPPPTAQLAPPAALPPSPPIPLLTAPPAPLGGDAVVFKLFKLLAETGAERDTYVALPDGGTEAKAVFSYRDRLQTVPLAATFEFAADGSLRRYAAWGKTSRFTTIDDRVDARGPTIEVTREDAATRTLDPASGPVAVASGYAPMLAQDLLLRAWGQRGRPRTMRLLPSGEVTIEARGKESYRRGTDDVTLEHVAVTGLVWGREDAWIDADGKLAAVLTRDAEFDHSEAAREGYEGLLPELARATGADGTAWLLHEARGARVGLGAEVLVGGTLIDGTGAPPLRDAVVVVYGDRIVAVGPRGSVPVPGDSITIDVSGKYVLPGLWDMHAHVQQVEQGVAYLAAGVTTVRDMGNILDFVTGMRDAIDANTGLGPRIVVEGLVDGEGPGSIGTVLLRSAEQIAPTLDRLKKAGCPEVKIYSSVPPALVPRIAAYAHAHGMRVVGHVPDGMTTMQAVEAGYDSISHVGYLLDPVLPAAETRKLARAERYRRIADVDLASPPMRRLFDALAAHHVVVDDTIGLWEQMLHTREDDAKREPGIATLPPELEGTLMGIPPAYAAAAEAAFQKYLAVLGELHKRGVRVVAGTDIDVPGHSLHRENELYVKAGWTPMEAIQAATIVPARYMHMDGELGTVQAGKRADLVVVDGDPLADPSNVRRTSLVVARGQAYRPDALWRLVGFRGRALP